MFNEQMQCRQALQGAQTGGMGGGYNPLQYAGALSAARDGEGGQVGLSIAQITHKLKERGVGSAFWPNEQNFFLGENEDGTTGWQYADGPVFSGFLSKDVAREQGFGYTYTIEHLNLDKMDLTALNAFGKIIDQGDISEQDAINQIAPLQQYFGYDNKEMVSALRELYYPDLLDPFIEDASDITYKDVLNLDGQGLGNGVAQSEAALALAILTMTKQGPGYKTPALTIGEDEIGLDHVISGLDGFFNFTNQAQSGVVQGGLSLLGSGEIDSIYENTWRGDLAATVDQAYNGMTGYDLPDIEGLDQFEEYEFVEKGYFIEMPTGDFEGDMMASNIIANGEELGLYGPGSDGTMSYGNDLAQVLETAYDPKGEYYNARYENFAQFVGLEIDPEGTILNRDEFKNDFGHGNQITALASGLILQDKVGDLIRASGNDPFGYVNAVTGVQLFAGMMADQQLDAFLNELEENLKP